MTKWAIPPGASKLMHNLLPLASQGIEPQVTLHCLETLRALSGLAPPPAYDAAPGQRRWELVGAGGAILALSFYFLYAMWRSYLQGYAIGAGFAVALALAASALWVIRYGWTKRR